MGNLLNACKNGNNIEGGANDLAIPVSEVQTVHKNPHDGPRSLTGYQAYEQYYPDSLRAEIDRQRNDPGAPTVVSVHPKEVPSVRIDDRSADQPHFRYSQTESSSRQQGLRNTLAVPGNGARQDQRLEGVRNPYRGNGPDD